MNAITVENLRKAYGENVVINGLSLTVGEGERLAILAPSGAGKTTLLRLIAGLEKPDAGRIEVSGALSYMFQEPRLFPQFTVLENVSAVLDGKDKKTRAAEYLRLAGLENDLRKYPDQLSGGMAQRAALARALAAGSGIFLLDEPFRGLDDAAKERLIATLNGVLKGKTLLLVTHDGEEAAALSCRVLRFGRGMIPETAQDPPSGL